MSVYRIGVEAARPGTAEAFDGGAPAGPFGQIASQLTKWIPGETLAIYVPGVTLLSGPHSRPSPVFLIVMIVATSLFTLGSAFSTGDPVTKAVWVSAVLAPGAFAIWSLSVPISGWQNISAIAANKGAVAIGAAVAGVLFGFVAEGITKHLSR